MKVGPDFIIIGAMKCATTTMHDQLSQQSGIFMSTPKEPEFFSDDEMYAKGIDWYRSHFAEAKSTDLCGESSTHYTMLPTYPNTVERMVKAFPDVKLIYIIRHPIDRLVSHYVHDWTENFVKGTIDAAALSHAPLVAYSEYARQLRPYVDAFGPNHIRVVFFERLVKEPAHVLGEIARFIGCESPLAWREEAEWQNVSSERLRKSPWRDALVNAPVLKQIRRSLVPRSAREWMKRFWRMQQRPELSPVARAELTNRFNEDLAQLAAWFDVPLTCASFREVALTHDLNWVKEPLAA